MKFFCGAAVGLAAIAACDRVDDEAAEPYDGPLYAVQHNINSPEGRLVYVNVLRDLDAPGDAVDISQGVELAGYSAVQAHNGALFVSDGESRQIARWDIDEAGRPQRGPVLSLANEAIDTFWNESFLYVDEDTVWYANSGASEILLWNPQSMELTGRIAVPGAEVSALPIGFHGLSRSGDRVFLTTSFVDWDGLTAHPEVVVVEFSVASESLVAIHRDDRCAVSMSTLTMNAVSDDGTFYVVGDAGFATFRHAGATTAPPSCVLRIRPTDAGFDPDWQVVLDGAIDGFADATTLHIDAAAGRVYTDLMRQPAEPFASADDLWAWQYGPGNTRRVGCDFPSFSNCAFVDGEFDGVTHWFTTSVDGRTLMTALSSAEVDTADFGGCNVYDMQPASPQKLFQTAGFISNIVRIR